MTLAAPHLRGNTVVEHDFSPSYKRCRCTVFGAGWSENFHILGSLRDGLPSRVKQTSVCSDRRGKCFKNNAIQPLGLRLQQSRKIFLEGTSKVPVGLVQRGANLYTCTVTCKTGEQNVPRETRKLAIGIAIAIGQNLESRIPARAYDAWGISVRIRELRLGVRTRSQARPALSTSDRAGRGPAGLGGA